MPPRESGSNESLGSKLANLPGFAALLPQKKRGQPQAVPFPSGDGPKFYSRNGVLIVFPISGLRVVERLGGHLARAAAHPTTHDEDTQVFARRFVVNGYQPASAQRSGS